MRAVLVIILAALGRGMSEKRVQFKLAATVAYEAVPSRAEALGQAAGLREVKRVFRHAPKHEAKHRAQGLHLWYTGTAATAPATGTGRSYVRSCGPINAASQGAETPSGACLRRAANSRSRTARSNPRQKRKHPSCASHCRNRERTTSRPTRLVGG